MAASSAAGPRSTPHQWAVNMAPEQPPASIFMCGQVCAPSPSRRPQQPCSHLRGWVAVQLSPPSVKSLPCHAFSVPQVEALLCRVQLHLSSKQLLSKQLFKLMRLLLCLHCYVTMVREFKSINLQLHIIRRHYFLTALYKQLYLHKLGYIIYNL